MQHIETYFRKKKASYSYVSGVIVSPNEAGEEVRHGLVNIAQQCRQAAPKEWKTLITRHFKTLDEIDQFNEVFNKRAHDFRYTQKYLGVRLYGSDYLTHIGEDIILTRPVMEGIIAMLVFDFPHSVVNVKPEQSILWSKSEDELFEIGLANMRANYRYNLSHESLGEAAIWFATADHFFTPNIIFDLQHDPKLQGLHGSLVGIPHRHAVLIYPINSVETIRMITQLLPVINGMHREGPGSISPQLYWYTNNNFHPLPYRIDEKTIQFTPPENFINMLNELK